MFLILKELLFQKKILTLNFMSTEILKLIANQEILPIIGKGSSQDIIDKFNRLVLEKYKVIEITLRSHDALETAINLKEQNPNITIGLGSIKSLKVFEEVTKFKFDFYVSPGTNIKMLDFAKKNQFLFIPGVSTPSEILTAIEYDCNILKYFHAEKNGGVKSLKFLEEIFNEIKFIPTGGINNENKDNYFSLENVIAVGSTNI